VTFTAEEFFPPDNLAGIDAKKQLPYAKSGRAVSAKIEVARLSDSELLQVQNERLLASNGGP
jgi:hypothetical protein